MEIGCIQSQTTGMKGAGNTLQFEKKNKKNLYALDTSFLES